MPNLPRSLEYKDRFVYHLIRQINGECEGEPITFPDNTTPIKFVVEMSLNEFTSILSALMTGADLSYPEDSHEIVWRFLRQVECPVSICDEILECLQPALDEINEQLGEINSTVEEIQQTQSANATEERALAQTAITGGICAGATNIVDAMHQTFVDTYEATEAAPLDNFAEFAVIFFSAVPDFLDLGFDEMIAAVNWYFENQFAQFETDYDTIREDMICDLRCFVELNGNVFDWDIWATWLEYLPTAYPGNRAAAGFSRYSPFRVTWVNQIAAIINKDASLQSYFDTLAFGWESGVMNPISCGDCDCDEITWCKTWDFTVSDGGWQVFGGFGTYTPGVGWSAPGQTVLWLYREDFGGRRLSSIAAQTDIETSLQAGIPYDTLSSAFAGSLFEVDPEIDTALNSGFFAVNNMAVRCTVDGIVNWNGTCSSYTICGYGIEPEWDE